MIKEVEFEQRIERLEAQYHFVIDKLERLEKRIVNVDMEIDKLK